MTEAPERIWINDTPEVVCGSFDVEPYEGSAEYIRADLVDPAAKSLDEHTALAIREAALRETAGVAHKGVEAFGAKMRAAQNKQEKRDWQSMLMVAVGIEYAILALIDKKEG